MTNGWIDIKNTDMMLIMGGNPAENHPCGFKWPVEAKRQRNAKMIVVDPRYTRTAAVADMFLQIRAGADIAFLGGVIRYALENQRINKEYLVNFTNAAFVIKEGFKLPDDGLYSGFDAEKQTYDKSTWNYEAEGASTGPGLPPKVVHDAALEHPRCVYQLLKQQYSRYTPEVVERITGIPKDQFLKAAELFTSVRKDGDTKKVATVIYAVGWTQHTFGSQIIRTACMLQLLMGNVGRAGGGVNALRGHSNIQGATDVAGIFDNLPGYLKVPNPNDKDFDGWMKRITPTASKPGEWDSMNYWGNTPKFAVSFMKTMYGDAAKKENGWAYDYLPKVDREYSWVHIWDDMYKGHVKGLLAFGMNGVAIGPNSQKNIDALKKADWLVVCEIYPDETSGFWASPGITAEDMKNIPTEVYRLPGAGFAEKDGTMVNSARWLQWKWAAVPPPGDARLDQEILARIFLHVRDLYKKEGGKFADPILNLTWKYTDPSESVALGNSQGAERPRAGRHHGQSFGSDYEGRPTVARLLVAARRWLDRFRKLALVRVVDRSRSIDAASGNGRSVGPWRLPELGLVVAHEPAGFIQSRVLRCIRQALGSRPAAGLVERSAEEVGRSGCPGLQSGFGAEGSHGAVHHESGRRGSLVCSAGRDGGWTVPGTL